MFFFFESRDPLIVTIRIVAHTSTGCLLAGSALGERGKSAEKVGIEAAEMLVNNLKDGGCVDEYLQDQLILFMALAKVLRNC